MVYYGMDWTVEFLDEDVQAVLGAMPADIRAAFRRIVELIAAHGLGADTRAVREGTWRGLSGKCG